MKIFISHSSKDKWAARRISEDLQRIGVTTFLDEKDIETGASIDDEITKHLKDCDELLLLLSPASIKSHWVLIEIGGAKALEKRLSPILLYISANEIPQPLSKHLARDINDIDIYYKEVENRNSGIAPREKPPRAPKPTEYSVGDKVVITKQNPPHSRVDEVGWDGDLAVYCGDEAVVTEVDIDRTVKLDVDGGMYWWAFEWLRHRG